ncbi:MAG: glycosyltransferase [Gammaproteobacteria bacterium]|nr:glycosyltransferase [Gammaproteobacteria bacterium]
MSAQKPRPGFAVVIATCDRLQMLAQRSLPSVVAQTRPPERLLVVDDSAPEVRPNNAKLVGSQVLPGCEISYLENERTKGASGAWNTALDFLVGRVEDPSEVFVAILDDDDAWSPGYLERCYAAVCDGPLDMVAADLRRFESVGGQPVLSEGPAQLRAEDFLTGNHGIQGPNLFVRLSVLLAAGGFDEALRSTTDRDLCIRIADLGSVRYGRLPVALCDHFADPNRPRLGTRGSQAKIDGLAAFWRKYAGRMTPNQRAAFSDRAQTLFDWRPARDAAVALMRTDVPKKALVLGLVADSARPGDLLQAVRELAGWQDKTLVGPDVVLIEQGRRSEAPALLEQATVMLRDSGAGCFRVSLEQQDEDAKRGLFRYTASKLDQSVCERRRETLRAYCGRVAASRTGAEVWIAQGARGAAPRGRRAADVLRWLRARREDAVKPITNNVAATAVAALDRWLQCERVATAGHRLRRRFSLERVRLLGCGSEAIVFTDERTVYKCIDYWKTRMPQSQLEFLRGQIGRWADKPGLYALREVLEDGPWVVLTYDYEASSPYQGGHEAGLIRLLDACSSVGIVCNNVHPKNLVVAPSGVKLIDYGSDIRPWTPLGFEHMARRAFLACKHAAHPHLQSLMRRVLSDPRLPEMAGYASFRKQLDGAAGRHLNARAASMAIAKAPPRQPLRLYVGVISSDPAMLKPLLHGLASLRGGDISELAALVLDNGSPTAALDAVVLGARKAGLLVAVVDQAQQRLDAVTGSFGSALRNRPRGQVGIARARTMLQRYLGALLAADPSAFGWVLDDDMRVDARARAYLPWLPVFREQGTDVLIGAYEGSSPNPPLNGLRVHLVDLLHNLHWLRSLPDDAVLPDRTAENAALRARYPDYYYDLSRKHTGHLEMPHWLEPAVPCETVREAYSRLLNGAVGLLNGAPLTRPIIATPPSDPLASAKNSVNRGGCTFILNHRSLSQTPNTITCVRGREARRSDMVWAIFNHHYRRMSIQAVGFPIHHVGRVNATPSLNVEKVQGEIVGSTLYAGLTEFLHTRPHHELDFSPAESDEVCRLADLHLDRRWRMLEQSFYRIAGLRESIRRLASLGELRDLVRYLDEWFTPQSFDRIRSGVGSHASGAVRDFLVSLRAVADDYAVATVDIDFIQAQLGAGATAMARGLRG